MQMEITQSLKVKAWCQRFNSFQIYLQMCLWLMGAKRGEWPTAYDEDQMREI